MARVSVCGRGSVRVFACRRVRALLVVAAARACLLCCGVLSGALRVGAMWLPERARWFASLSLRVRLGARLGAMLWRGSARRWHIAVPVSRVVLSPCACPVSALQCVALYRCYIYCTRLFFGCAHIFECARRVRFTGCACLLFGCAPLFRILASGSAC